MDWTTIRHFRWLHGSHNTALATPSVLRTMVSNNCALRYQLVKIVTLLISWHDTRSTEHFLVLFRRFHVRCLYNVYNACFTDQTRAGLYILGGNGNVEV